MQRNDEKNVSRPALLNALCILTFIGSGIAFIGYFLASLFFEQTKNLIVQYSSWHITGALKPVYFTLLMVFFALSLTGALRMWKKHIDGFYLYIFAQLAILFTPVIWFDWLALSTTNAVFTVVFVSGYALNLKWLRTK